MNTVTFSVSILFIFVSIFIIFTVDFNEEYSALFGGILEDQRLYLELCIQTVLKLYKNSPNPPKSVSIVAHSMVNYYSL